MEVEKILFEKNKCRIISAVSKALSTPYYKELLYTNHIRIGDINNYSDFTKIPITTKEQLRYRYIDFVNKTFISNDLEYSLLENKDSYFNKNVLLFNYGLELYVTSGSTGIPMEILRGRKDVFNNFFNLNKFRKIYGDIDSLEKYVWVLPESMFMRKYVFDENSEYFKDSDHGFIYCIDNITDEKLKKFIEFCKKKKIQALIGWPSFLEKLTDYLENHFDTEFVNSIKHLESNSEILLATQEEKIKKLFKQNVLNVYSGVETNFIAVANENGDFHLLHNNVFIEFVDNDGGSKKLLVTNLNCNETALLRYEIGDLGDWIGIVDSVEEKYPYIFKICQARNNDKIKAKNGSRYEFNLVADIVHIAQNELDFQFDKYIIVQKTYTLFEFKYIYKFQQDEILFKKFIESAISNVLGYKIDLVMNHKKEINQEFGLGRKFRFFECQVHD